MSIINTAEIGKLKKNKLDLAGGTLTGNLSLGDNVKATFGASDDLQIYHDGSHSYISDAGTGDLTIRASNDLRLQAASTEAYITCNENSSVQLYYDNVEKLATSSPGIDVTGTVTMDGGSTSADFSFGDSDKAIFGAGSDLQIYHDGSNSWIKDTGTGSLYIDSNGNGTVIRGKAGEDSIVANADSSVDLYHNNAKKLATTSTGIDVTGTVTMDGGSTSADFSFGDSDKAIFGAGSDLQIYHGGSNSYIDDTGTGNLIIRGQNVVIDGANNERIATFTQDGAVTLKYDNATKFATTSTGIDVTGTVTADQLSIDDGNSVIDSGAQTISNVAATVDSWATTKFQSAKYTITARGNGNKFQVSEILLFHDNANNAYLTEYGIMSSDGNPFVTYTVDVSADSVRLRATLDAAWSGGNNVKFTRFAQDII